ncbi:organic hydroperoxide resistance transcriptional regulator [Methanobrevibacter cuticularis]|uniref:HTH-type transcriptional regulator SarZ n=1 Tax=Methanobrevibacter cuticularis TaxID=47311 RepID=A0A166F6E6_9EURY|nr:MarR family winged helix-turn-helix transcriptional regulator [Methanobrevibacter cuticularis]KZX17362.1 organic hydroperoxide resistance transcriptional regulator [Methanobrevibacter cuticularis]
MDSIKNFGEDSSFEYPLAALISIIYRTHNVYLNHILEEFNLTAGQIPFILHLLKKQNISQNDFAEDLFVDKGTVAIALKRLEKEGIVKRKRLDDNRRKYIIYFTPSGREIALNIEKLNKEWEDSILEGLTDLQKEKVMELAKSFSLKSIEIIQKCSDM